MKKYCSMDIRICKRCNLEFENTTNRKNCFKCLPSRSGKTKKETSFKTDLLKEISSYTKKEKISYFKRLEILETMLWFANDHHTSANGEKMRFDNDSFPHMRELYETGALHKDICIMAGTQIGKTDWVVIYILAAAYCGLNVFFVLPKDDMRDRYVTEKVLMRVKLSPFYMDILRDGVSKSKDLIHFGKGKITFVGATSEANFSSFSADIVVVDETDDVAIPANLELAPGRMTQSDHKYTRYISNTKGVNGFINKRYQLSDKRVRMFPCTKCKEIYEIDWFESVIKLLKDDDGNVVGHALRDKEWDGAATSDIKAMCPRKNEEGVSNCCGYLERFAEGAKWVPTAIAEQDSLVGYKMPTFVSPSVSIRELYQEYKRALDSPSAMEAFYIKSLAEPYSSSGNKVSEDLLNKCVLHKDFEFTIKEDQAFYKERLDNPCVMGVDTAEDHWDVTISHQERMGNPYLHRLVFVGKMSPKDGLNFLHELVDRYNVVCTIIDAEPCTLAARSFQEECNSTVWRCETKGMMGKEMKYDHKDGQLVVNRREMLDKSYAVLKTGQLILPANYEHILEGQYVKEMTSLSRISEQNNRGVWVPKWIGPNQDHLRLSDGYRNLAVETLSATILTGASNIFIG